MCSIVRGAQAQGLDIHAACERAPQHNLCITTCNIHSRRRSMVAMAQGNCRCISIRSTLSRKRDLTGATEAQLGGPVRHSPLILLPWHSLETPSHLHPATSIPHLRSKSPCGSPLSRSADANASKATTLRIRASPRNRGLIQLASYRSGWAAKSNTFCINRLPTPFRRRSGRTKNAGLLVARQRARVVPRRAV